jgi:hypothetical protein
MFDHYGAPRGVWKFATCAFLVFSCSQPYLLWKNVLGSKKYIDGTTIE